MDRKLTEADARGSLREHIREKAMSARLKHGPLIDAQTITRIIDDPEVVRYPLGIRFDAQPLEPGEFACLEPLGDHPSKGFCLFVHPCLEARPELLTLVVAYYVPSVNYGEIAASDEAELFGATLMGLDVEGYYQALCEIADSITQKEGGSDAARTCDPR